MRAIRIFLCAAAALMFAGIAAVGAAQQAPAGGALTAAQLRELAAKATTPADHAQLRDHFAIIAQQYEADAKRFSAKASFGGGNPNRRAGDYQAHWTRLRQTAAAMAKSARELVTFHEQLATGAPATRPAESAHVEHLEQGAGAPAVMSDAQFQQLLATAQTAADHTKLKEYFTSIAARY